MKILQICWTIFGNKIKYWKKGPSRLRVKSLCAPVLPFLCCPGRAVDMSKPITAIVTSNGDPHPIPGTDSVPYVNDLYVDSVKSSSFKPVANQIGEWSCFR